MWNVHIARVVIFSASCESVNDPKARFEILKIDGRCFVCLGHQSTSCEKSCHPFKGNHHRSFCPRQTHLKSQPDLSANKNSQGAQFYCKLLQRLQEMKIVQNLQELRSYLTMEVGDNLKSRLDLHEKINASPQYIWRKNLSKTEMRYSNLVSWGR